MMSVNSIGIKRTTIATSQAKRRIERGASEHLCRPLRPTQPLHRRHSVAHGTDITQPSPLLCRYPHPSDQDRRVCHYSLSSLVPPKLSQELAQELPLFAELFINRLDIYRTQQFWLNSSFHWRPGYCTVSAYELFLAEAALTASIYFSTFQGPAYRRTAVKQMKRGADGIALYLSPNCFSVELAGHLCCHLLLAAFYSSRQEISKCKSMYVERACSGVLATLSSRPSIQMCDWLTCVFTFLHPPQLLFRFNLLSDWSRFVGFKHMSSKEPLLQTESQAEESWKLKAMLFGLKQRWAVRNLPS